MIENEKRAARNWIFNTEWDADENENNAEVGNQKSAERGTNFLKCIHETRAVQM